MIHTRDISDDFFPTLKGIASELGANPRDMLAVMFSESGCSARAHNDNPKDKPPHERYNASGLIQFMPPTLASLGWRQGHAAFRELTATQQLPFVRRYYWAYRRSLGSVGGLYVATFLPALVRHAGDRAFVLTAKNGPLGWAYAPNASFDANRDLAITVGELEDAVARNAKGPRWAELLARLGVVEPVAPIDDAVDLRTTLGIQRALERLGFDPGPIDGIPGALTRSAVVAFQRAASLAPDGIVGPLTRTALDERLVTC